MPFSNLYYTNLHLTWKVNLVVGDYFASEADVLKYIAKATRAYYLALQQNLDACHP